MVTQTDSALTLLDYRGLVGQFDAALSEDGQIRPSWSAIGRWIERKGAAGLDHHSRQMQQLIRDNGATFTIEGTESQQSRPWKLAVVPHVIGSETWEPLQSGLRQRNRLLQAVLADLLGPQNLVRERLVPPELLWANPNFRRTYHSLPVIQDGRGHQDRLIVTGTDLARSSNGSWLVIGDRTRAPSGLGYLLENRVVTTQVLSQLARGCHVRRIASFFQKLRRRMQSLAPRMRENPRVALLTPGPQSYRYFEDAYLARYLGYTLVQGSDLAVRGDRLNLKTLGGLLPVEVIWRHVSDHKCDPLELDPSSAEGVTGLLRMVRRGTIAIGNAIGSELAQMPALTPFLPAACERLLGEPLALQQVETLWCGDDASRQRVRQSPRDFIFRDAFTINEMPPIVGEHLSEAALQELLAKVEHRPHQFVASRKIEHATTPVWSDGQLNSWHVSIRAFSLCDGPDVEVLPGALSRVSPAQDDLLKAPTAGQLTVDCWICDRDAGDGEITLLPDPKARIPLARTGDELPSRVAEHLYWLGRYVERCESIARLLRTTLKRLAEDDVPAEQSSIPRLIAALAGVGQIEPDYAIQEWRESFSSLDIMLPGSVFSRNQPNGLQQAALSMVYNAAAVRDRLSIDAYRILKRVADELDIQPPHQTGAIGPAIERLNRLIADLLAFAGLTAESMTRTHTHAFLQLGRRIERTHQTAEWISATLVSGREQDRPTYEAVLEATDSLMTYHARYMNIVQPELVLDLLVTDETNPRSIEFQLRVINETLDTLPRDTPTIGLHEDQRIARQLLHEFEMTQPADFEPGRNGARTCLQAKLESITNGLPALSNAIAAQFFFHTSPTRQLTGAVGETDTPGAETTKNPNPSASKAGDTP